VTSLAASTRGMISQAEHSTVGQELPQSESNLDVPTHVSKMLFFKACVTLMSASLVMGLAVTTSLESEQFHEAARVLSSHTNQSENVSNFRFGVGPPSGPISSLPTLGTIGSLPAGSLPTLGTIGSLPAPSLSSVNTLCLCNWGPRVQLIVNGRSRLQGNPWWSARGGWVGNPPLRRCECFNSRIMQQYQQEGGELRCGYFRADAPNTRISCSGRSFSYSSTSSLSGRYICSGSPPVCRNPGYCQGSACLQT